MRICSAIFLIITLLLTFLLNTSTDVQAQANNSNSLEKKGRMLFLQCQSCHEIKETKIIKIGPHLAGVLGRAAGTLPGYSYSTALRSLSISWDEAQLDRWLEKPTQVAPGTTMAFIGFSNPQDRLALIAYLKTLK